MFGRLLIVTKGDYLMSKDMFLSTLMIVVLLASVVFLAMGLSFLYHVWNDDHSIIRYEFSDTDSYETDKWVIYGIRDYWPDAEISVSMHEYTFDEVVEKVDQLNEQLKKNVSKQELEKTEAIE